MSKLLTPGEMLRQRAQTTALSNLQHDISWEPVGRFLHKRYDLTGTSLVLADQGYSQTLGGYRAADDTIALNMGRFRCNAKDLWSGDTDQAQVFAAVVGTLLRAKVLAHLPKDLQGMLTTATVDAQLAGRGKEIDRQSLRQTVLQELLLVNVPHSAYQALELVGSIAIYGASALLNNKEYMPVITAAEKVFGTKLTLELTREWTHLADETTSDIFTPLKKLKKQYAKIDRRLLEDERQLLRHAVLQTTAALRVAQPPSKILIDEYDQMINHLLGTKQITGLPSLHKLVCHQDLGPVGVGVSGSHFARDMVGDDWVVKGHRDQKLCMREAMCSLLAQYMGVLTPASGIIQWTNGKLLFASRKTSGSSGAITRACRADQAGLVLFDALVTNTDRHSGNVLLQTTGGQTRCWAIDHGHTTPFGNRVHVTNVKQFGWADYEPYLRRLKRLQVSDVEAMLQSMPKGWQGELGKMTKGQAAAQVYQNAQEVVLQTRKAFGK